MYSLIADISVPGIPEPVPVIGKFILAVWLLLSRSQKAIPIDAGWYRLIRRVSDGEPPPEALAASVINRTHNSLAQQLHGTHLMRHRTALRSHLHHAIVFASRLYHLLALKHVVARRLLDVNILPGLASPDRCERVPMIRRRDRDCIYVLGVEHRAHIGVFFRIVVLHFAYRTDGSLAGCLVYVAHRCHPAIRVEG